MQIGVALVLYDQDETHLPVVPELGAGAGQRGSSPLKALLETLALSDFSELAVTKTPRKKSAGVPVKEQPVRGFICPSDPNAKAGYFRAPISYRANAGSTPDGRDGVFSPGRSLRLAAIEDADGLGFTAAFSERLAGNNQPESRLENYAIAPGPLGAGGCPAGLSTWRGDAGASWFVADWQSTLYNHALTPNARPSCLSQGAATAYMGASSGHLGGANVLLFDGSVRFYSSGVDPKVWKELATPGLTTPGQGAP